MQWHGGKRAKHGKHSLLIFAIACLLLPLCGAARSQTGQVLSTVKEVRGLTPEQAHEGRPIVLQGLVTVLSGWKSSFFFQDETGGISVDRTTDAPSLASGDRVEIHGVSGAGKFAPIVGAESVVVFGKGKLPKAQLFGPIALSGGREDSQWIAVRGIVRQSEVKESWGRSTLFLTIGIGGGNLVSARVGSFKQGDAERLAGALVNVEGVCGTVFNDKRQFIANRLFVASTADVHIERPAPTSLMDAPIKPLDGLMQFGDKEEFTGRVKVRGTVTYAAPGEELFIQDGRNGLLIESIQTTALPLGTEIEAVGYPAQGNYSPKLVNAVYRIVGHDRAVYPSIVRAADVVVIRDDFPAAPLDGALVRIQGKLIDELLSKDSRSLLLQDGNVVFMAELPRGSADEGPLAVGSVLSVTGICEVNADGGHDAKAFSLLLRSGADVVVMQRASWWTAQHLLYVVGVLMLIVVALAAWAIFARRQADLHELAVKDSLTGIYNRRGFLLLAQQQWQFAQRRGVPLLLFYIDVDRFKEINDSFGHKQGDVALKTVANILRDSFRKADIVGRLGGDEFAIAALDAPGHTKQLLEDRIAALVALANEKQRTSFELSLSIGVVECGTQLISAPIEELIEEADSRMYENKRKRKSSQTRVAAIEAS